jgi:hypothetical protein
MFTAGATVGDGASVGDGATVGVGFTVGGGGGGGGGGSDGMTGIVASSTLPVAWLMMPRSTASAGSTMRHPGSMWLGLRISRELIAHRSW